MVYTEKTIDKYNFLKKEKTDKLNNYKKIALKVKKMEEENKEIYKRIKAIVELKERQGMLLKVLYPIFSEIKENKIFFRNLRADQGKVLVDGYAVSYEDLAQYLKELELKKEIFKNIDLKSAHEKKLGTYEVIEFNVEITL